MDRLRMLLAMLLVATDVAAEAHSAGDGMRLVDVRGGVAELEGADGLRMRGGIGDRVGDWSVMHVDGGDEASVVLEDFVHRDGGHLLVLGRNGVVLDAGKTAEPTDDRTGGRFLGHGVDAIGASEGDLLGRGILARAGDPRYEDVAAVFAPITRVQGGTLDFVGTPLSFDKVGFTYGGRSPNFDPSILQPSIEAVRAAGMLRRGLVGGDLPVLRWVYPDDDDAWTELLAFAPWRLREGNDRVQPVWYRVTRVEHGAVRWVRVFDTYFDAPMARVDDAARRAAFYRSLREQRSGWDERFAGAMRVEIPDARLRDMARLSLSRAMMTRVGDYPKYGVLDRNYGAAEHDGFPDTFTVEAGAMLDWGLPGQAGRIIDNWFTHFVDADGGLLYRGPETAQYGRMLTIVAQYLDYGGDAGIVLRHRAKIEAIANLLLRLRHEGERRPASDPAHGLISGWSEADSVLEAEPARYDRPYFANSAAAVRGWRDLGAAWIALASRDAGVAVFGKRLQAEADALERDLHRALARSVLHADGEDTLPSIAGATQPFHVAVARDRLDPQYRAYRAHMEALYSGVLPDRYANMIVDYRERHHDVVLGVPTAYGLATGEVAGFLAYGHGYGLLQLDRVREALLLLYSDAAHQYTRGSWMAPETRRPLLDADAAPYCVPAQLVEPLMLRWLLVLENPRDDSLWLAKGVPREWLAAGKVVAVHDAPTRWGRIGYRIESKLDEDRVQVELQLPADGIAGTTRLRLRVPDGRRLMRAQTAQGRLLRIARDRETIEIPAGARGRLAIEARYAESGRR